MVIHRSSLLSAVIAAAVWSASAVKSSVQTPQFSSRTDLIQLDISVVDKKHEPVRGLTKDDFLVRENGKPQQVVNVLPVDVQGPKSSSVAWVRDVAPDVSTNSNLSEDRLTVIVMDDEPPETKSDLAAIKSARDIGARIIRELGPQDLAAVVYTANSTLNQEFTRDRARLLKAVSAFNPGASSGNQASELSVLRRIAEVLGSIPDRRKNLIWITAGTPMPEPTDRFGAWDAWIDLLDAARRASVNIYTVDPTGLQTPIQGTAREPEVRGVNPELEADRLARRRMLLSAASGNTGGRSFLDTNELASSIGSIFQETSSFYLLGYVSTNPTPDGKFRRVEVKVNRPGVTVHTRAGYYADPATNVRKTPPATSPSSDAIAGLLPKHDTSVTLTAMPFGGTTGTAVIALVSTDGMTGDEFDGRLEAFTFDGTRKSSTSIHGRIAGDGYGISQALSLPPGRYQLRVGVTTRSTGKSGSVYADLDVPDFTKGAVSLSAVALSLQSAQQIPVGDAEMRAQIPWRPTAQRVFSATDHVEAFWRVYEGDSTPIQPVTVEVSIRDTSDTKKFVRTERLEGAQFDQARSSNTRFALPFSTLTQGEYLLTITATLGTTTARRDVRFTIR